MQDTAGAAPAHPPVLPEVEALGERDLVALSDPLVRHVAERGYVGGRERLALAE